MSWSNLPYPHARHRPNLAPKAPDSVARVEAEAAEYRRKSLEQTEREAAEKQEHDEEASRRSIERGQAEIVREYASRGLKPVTFGSSGMLVSLPLLLSIGYKVQDTPRGPVLVAPPPEEPRPRAEGEGQQT